MSWSCRKFSETALPFLFFKIYYWIAFFFQRVNATELLRLYINYDLLLEAVMLAVEYIEAVLGNGKEYFGLKVIQTSIFSLDWGIMCV